jgi:hypothetical protein
MHAFKMLNVTHGDTKLSSASLNQRKLSKLSVSDCLKCYEVKIHDELGKLKSEFICEC